MTKRLLDGFELGKHEPGLYSISEVGGRALWVTSPVRSGTYALSLGKTIAVSEGWAKKTVPATAEGFAGIGLYLVVNANTYPFFSVRKDGTTLISVSLNTTNKNFTVSVGGAVVATGTFVYSTGMYYRLELNVKIDDVAGSIQLKVDGVIDIDYSGDTKPGADAQLNNLYYSTTTNDNVVSLYLDDLTWNDTTGAVDNSWCGDGRILYIPTNGAGDVTQLTPNTGANYAAVDDVPSDGDTTYVESGTVDQYDLYNLAASGLAAGSQIKRVVPVATAKDTVANGGKIKLGIKTNGTEYFGDDLTLTTDYTSQAGTEHTVNPQTGVAWTIAELDALQSGVKVRGT